MFELKANININMAVIGVLTFTDPRREAVRLLPAAALSTSLSPSLPLHPHHRRRYCRRCRRRRCRRRCRCSHKAYFCRTTNLFCFVVLPPPLFYSTHTLLLQANPATTATLEAAIHIYSFTTAVLQPANASPRHPQCPACTFPPKPTHELCRCAYSMAST